MKEQTLLLVENPAEGGEVLPRGEGVIDRLWDVQWLSDRSA